MPRTAKAGAQPVPLQPAVRRLVLLVGLEFLENGMFVFAASHVIGGVDAEPGEFARSRPLMPSAAW